MDRNSGDVKEDTGRDWRVSLEVYRVGSVFGKGR